VCAPTLGAPPGAAPAENRPPLVAGRYAAHTLLGRGASKAVYLARDERLDRDVALSLVAGEGRDRVEAEARVMARLGEHPNVVTVHDAGEDAGVPFLVARYMVGGSLAERLAREADGRLPVAAAVRAAREIASALAHAHAHAVVHRDVKPDNVWLAGDGSAGLGDFGIARRDRAPAAPAPGIAVGTVPYMSPEQARGERADARSDLYSLGATLYELLTGRPPFRGGTAAAVLTAHLDEEPLAPSQLAAELPKALDDLVLALLAKAPADRPASAEAVVAALAAIETGGHTRSRPAVARTRRLVGRGPQLDALQGAVQEARAGRGRLVALAGEAGIGKTRIAEELAAWARTRGTTVLWGRCVEDEGAPAYLPWTQVLRELATSVPAVELPDEAGALLPGAAGAAPPASPEEARFRRFEAISRLLSGVAGWSTSRATSHGRTSRSSAPTATGGPARRSPTPWRSSFASRASSASSWRGSRARRWRAWSKGRPGTARPTRSSPPSTSRRPATRSSWAKSSARSPRPGASTTPRTAGSRPSRAACARWWRSGCAGSRRRPSRRSRRRRCWAAPCGRRCWPARSAPAATPRSRRCGRPPRRS
jgi:eukaryotic-like serine/threonine-protein kinase